MKTAIALLAFVSVALCASAASTTTWAGYWYFYSSDCTSTAATDTVSGDGLEDAYFFPTSSCVKYNSLGGDMFYYYSYYYNFTCNDTHIAWQAFDYADCAGTPEYTGTYTLNNCGTDHDYVNYDCITEYPSPDDYDTADILDAEGEEIEVSAAVNYYNDTTCTNAVASNGGGYASCYYPYYKYCDGGNLVLEFCVNSHLDCSSGCDADGTYAPEDPLEGDTCYTAATIPTGWAYPTGLTGNLFEIYLNSYYQSTQLVFCEGSGSGSDAGAITVSFGLVALAAALAL